MAYSGLQWAGVISTATDQVRSLAASWLCKYWVLVPLALVPTIHNAQSSRPFSRSLSHALILVCLYSLLLGASSCSSVVQRIPYNPTTLQQTLLGGWLSFIHRSVRAQP